jgi:hypothetical protein
MVLAPHVFYAMENLDKGTVVRRGMTASASIPQNGRILPAGSNFREWLYNADTRLIGHTEFRTPSAGQRFTIPTIPLGRLLRRQPDG